MSRYLSVCHIVRLCLLSVCLSALYLSFCLSVSFCLSAWLFVSVSQFVCLWLSVCLTAAYMSACASALYLSVSVAVCISACLSACLPACLYTCLSLCPPTGLSVCIYLFVSLNVDNFQKIWHCVLWIRDVCDFKDVTCSCLRRIHTLYIVRTFLCGKRDIPVGCGPVKFKNWDVLVIDRFWLDRVCCWLCFPITMIQLLTCSSVTFGSNWRKIICILWFVLRWPYAVHMM